MDTMTLKKKVNIRNIIIFIAIIIIFIVLSSTVLFMFRHSPKNTNTLTTFSSIDSTISLSIYDSLGFVEHKSDDYILELKSEKSGAGIFVSKVSTNNIRDMHKYIEADKNDYVSKFSDISQVSDISEYTLQSCPIYNYHFTYKDTMYVDVYWILKDNNFYVIDFNIDKNVEDLGHRIGEILNSLKFN